MFLPQLADASWWMLGQSTIRGVEYDLGVRYQNGTEVANSRHGDTSISSRIPCCTGVNIKCDEVVVHGYGY